MTTFDLTGQEMGTKGQIWHCMPVTLALREKLRQENYHKFQVCLDA